MFMRKVKPLVLKNEARLYARGVAAIEMKIRLYAYKFTALNCLY
jgi:hypothetical protein